MLTTVKTKKLQCMQQAVAWLSNTLGGFHEGQNVKQVFHANVAAHAHVPCPPWRSARTGRLR